MMLEKNNIQDCDWLYKCECVCYYTIDAACAYILSISTISSATGTITVSPSYNACLEKFTNTKSKCDCPVRTASPCGFGVLLFLLQHKFSQHVSAVLGPYDSSLPLKDNWLQVQNQCLNQKPQV